VRVGEESTLKNQMEVNDMFATLRNESVSAELLSYALAQGNEGGVELVWAEFVPTHPKIISAVWASLVTNSSRSLTLVDADTTRKWSVQPLKRAYRRYEAECPDLSGRSKFIRLVHPNVGKGEQGEDFYILDRFQHTPAQLLAATLEYNTNCPVLISWGEYLLATAQTMGDAFCQKLVTGGIRPVEGYWFSGNISWQKLVAKGVEKGVLSLEGHCYIPADIPMIEQEMVV
jgi:hypothetical protein